MAGLPGTTRTDQSSGFTMRWPACQIPDNATGAAEGAPIEVEGGIDSLPIPSRT
jgi:hypothetical protein